MKPIYVIFTVLGLMLFAFMMRIVFLTTPLYDIFAHSPVWQGAIILAIIYSAYRYFSDRSTRVETEATKESEQALAKWLLRYRDKKMGQ